MTYYSIIPVYEEPQEVVEYVEMDYAGYNILACKCEEGYMLERIYSSEPTDFLKNELQPGTLLDNRLINKIV